MQVNIKDELPPLDQLIQSLKESQLIALSIPGPMMTAAVTAIPKIAAFASMLPFPWIDKAAYWLTLLADFVDDLTPGESDVTVLLRFPTLGTHPDKDHMPESVDLLSCTITVSHPKSAGK